MDAVRPRAIRPECESVCGPTRYARAAPFAHESVRQSDSLLRSWQAQSQGRRAGDDDLVDRTVPDGSDGCDVQHAMLRPGWESFDGYGTAHHYGLRQSWTHSQCGFSSRAVAVRPHARWLAVRFLRDGSGCSVGDLCSGCAPTRTLER